jgi:hypothetical protein
MVPCFAILAQRTCAVQQRPQRPVGWSAAQLSCQWGQAAPTLPVGCEVHTHPMRGHRSLVVAGESAVACCWCDMACTVCPAWLPVCSIQQACCPLQHGRAVVP